MNQAQRQLLSDCSLVLQLKASPAWEVILRDAKANFDDISYSWFNLPADSVELKEARARQIANAEILGLMDKYQARYNEVASEVMEKEDPANYQVGDVDNGVEEDANE